jgi:hypothetical protein
MTKWDLCLEDSGPSAVGILASLQVATARLLRTARQ